MGLGDLGQLGDIGGIIGSMLGISVAAIVLLTFAPGIAGDIDGFSLSARGEGRCEYQGEVFAWLLNVGSNTYTDGAEAWESASSNSILKLKGSSGKCIDAAGTPAGGDSLYTPKGKHITGTDLFKTAIGEWKNPNRSLTALGGGTIVLLLFSASAILLPAGAIGFLGYFGARFIADQVGGGVLTTAIVATIAVVLAGAVLPQIFEPLDRLYLALDGDRYWVYSVGIGTLGPIIGNFMGISLLGGIVTLGMLLWKGTGGSKQMSSAM